MYKTQLQELCCQRGWSLPKYSDMNDGPQHKPSYKASVLVNGVSFTSSGTFYSSKEAQNQAALRAFLNLTSPSSGGLHLHASFSSSTKEIPAIQSTRKPNIAKSKLIHNSEDELLDQEMLHNGMHNGSFSLPPNKKIKISNMCSSSSHTKLPPLSISEFDKAKTSNTNSYLLGNRYKVYTSFPNIKFPEGITIVPIGEDKWIAASLECLNDEDV